MCLYIDFLNGSASSTSGISCMYPSFWLGGMDVGNVQGNTSQYLHNTINNGALLLSFTFNKCGIGPSGKSLSLYSASYKNNTGLPNVFKYLLYDM